MGLLQKLKNPDGFFNWSNAPFLFNQKQGIFIILDKNSLFFAYSNKAIENRCFF
jgi:hypothetical protein